ncbi:tellurite resistance TerB family protein [Rhodoplanes sp. SY1]|uniref:tellurite resistance TerB family protein n=1 Tax=Rhodoplanes sp. SY1 TaxID=3166646 RepID=UPI0038B5C68D
MFDVNKILTAVLAGDGAGAPPPATSRDTGFLTRGRGLPPAGQGGAAQGQGGGLPFDLGSLAGRLGGLAGGSPLGAGGGGGLGDLLGRNAGMLGAGGLAGGLAGILLNSKHARKYAGTALKVGAAAVLGGLAYKAYQDYRAGRPVVPQGVADTLGQMLGGPQGGATAASGPAGAPAPGSEAAAARTTLLLLRAMIGAALADGRIDEAERVMLIERIEASPLSVEERQVLEGLVARPDTPASLAADAATPEERAEVYLAAYVAIDADTPAERAWLDDLAARLQLDPRLRQNLETAGDAAAAA